MMRFDRLLPSLVDLSSKHQRSGRSSRSPVVQSIATLGYPHCQRQTQRGNCRSREGMSLPNGSLMCIAPMTIAHPTNWTGRVHSFVGNHGTCHTVNPIGQVAQMNRAQVGKSGMWLQGRRPELRSRPNHHQPLFQQRVFHVLNLHPLQNYRDRSCGKHPGYDC